MKKVSILICTHNRSNLLRECIESALEQSYPNIEILVSDDCSDDDTREIVYRYPVRYQWHSKNVGRVNNYRSAYWATDGEFVLLLDDDNILIDRDFIRDAVEMDCGFTMGGDYVGGDRKDMGKNLLRLPNVGTCVIPHEEFLNEYYNIHFSFSVFKRCYVEKPFPHDILSADMETILPCFIGDVGIIKRGVALWYQHGGNASGNGSLLEHWRNRQWISAVAERAERAGIEWRAWYLKAMYRHLVGMGKSALGLSPSYLKGGRNTPSSGRW